MSLSKASTSKSDQFVITFDETNVSKNQSVVITLQDGSWEITAVQNTQ